MAKKKKILLIDADHNETRTHLLKKELEKHAGGVIVLHPSDIVRQEFIKINDADADHNPLGLAYKRDEDPSTRRVQINVFYGYYPGAAEAVEKIKEAVDNNELFALAMEDQESFYVFNWYTKTVTFFGKDDYNDLVCPDMGRFMDQIKLIFLTHKLFIGQEQLSLYLKAIRDGENPAPFKSLESVRKNLYLKSGDADGPQTAGD